VNDALLLFIVIAFFALSGGFIVLCDRV